ncbi:ABC transporter permease [Dysosmobacter sp. Phy]
MKKLLKGASREVTLVVAIVLMGVIFTLINSSFFTPRNLINILDQTTINGLLAVGITLAILTGGIDLSIGAILGMTAVLVGQWLVNGMAPLVAVLVGMVLGFSMGCLNGILIAKLKLQPFIATLGTCSALRGLTYIYTGGWPIMNIPENFRDLVDGDLFGWLPSALVMMVIFMAICHILLRKTKFGLYTYALGNNESATKLSGVNVDLYKILAYGISGMGGALAGLVMIARLGSAEPSAGDGYEMYAIAAAAIGGTSLAGGKGNVVATLIGAILLQTLKTGLVVVSVDPYWQRVATGAIIVIAAYFETARNQLSMMRQKHA